MKKAQFTFPRRSVDGLLLLDKPRGMTSNQALQKVRNLFRAEKAGSGYVVTVIEAAK